MTEQQATEISWLIQAKYQLQPQDLNNEEEIEGRRAILAEMILDAANAGINPADYL